MRGLLKPVTCPKVLFDRLATGLFLFGGSKY